MTELALGGALVGVLAITAIANSLAAGSTGPTGPSGSTGPTGPMSTIASAIATSGAPVTISSTPPTSGQILLTSSAVAAAWATAGVTVALVTKFTTGTSVLFTPNTTTKICIIELYGAGGGGGGTRGGTNQISVAGGGASGGYCMKIYAGTPPLTGFTYTIGVGGAGGIGSGTTFGGGGGNSTVSSLIISPQMIAAGGGSGGGVGPSAGSLGSGGGGGAPSSGGDINYSGNGGGQGFGFFISPTCLSISGAGGSFGEFSGGISAQAFSTLTAQNGFSNSNGLVAGGSGASGCSTSGVYTPADGGAGGSGLLVITEFR